MATDFYIPGSNPNFSSYSLIYVAIYIYTRDWFVKTTVDEKSPIALLPASIHHVRSVYFRLLSSVHLQNL